MHGCGDDQSVPRTVRSDTRRDQPLTAARYRAAMPGPVEFLRAVAPGTRVVIRARIPGGFTDTLGHVRSCSIDTVTVRTRTGDRDVVLAAVVAAKAVPEPPPRRGPRTGPEPS